MRRLIVTGFIAACVAAAGGCGVNVGTHGSASPAPSDSTTAASADTGPSAVPGATPTSAGATASPGATSGRVRSGGQFCEGYDTWGKVSYWQALLDRGDQDELRKTFRESYEPRSLWHETAPADILPEARQYGGALDTLQAAFEAASWNINRLEPAVLNSLKDPKYLETVDQIARWVDKHCGPKPA